MDARIRTLDEHVFHNTLRPKLAAALSRTHPCTPEQLDVQIDAHSRLRSRARLRVTKHAESVVCSIELPAGTQHPERDILIPLLCQVMGEQHCVAVYQAAFDQVTTNTKQLHPNETKDAIALRSSVLGLHLPDDTILCHQSAIQEEVLTRSSHLRTANFTRIHTRDLALLFELYDGTFFTGLCKGALANDELTFRLSTRMTRAGGTTTRFRSTTGDVRYEIAISCGLLFDSFGSNNRPITVCGRPCTNRLEALQRIVEHELVHLIEQVCWGESDCSRQRFQDIALRHFLHQAHTHQLITRRERAATAGIRAGTPVTFLHEGMRYTGIVNRITKRATVLVEDAAGQPFADGRRYRTYYVPLELLQPMPQHQVQSVTG